MDFSTMTPVSPLRCINRMCHLHNKTYNSHCTWEFTACLFTHIISFMYVLSSSGKKTGLLLLCTHLWRITAAEWEMGSPDLPYTLSPAQGHPWPSEKLHLLNSHLALWKCLLGIFITVTYVLYFTTAHRTCTLHEGLGFLFILSCLVSRVLHLISAQKIVTIK